MGLKLMSNGWINHKIACLELMFSLVVSVLTSNSFICDNFTLPYTLSLGLEVVCAIFPF